MIKINSRKRLSLYRSGPKGRIQTAGKTSMGLNENSFVFGGDAEFSVLEYAIAQLLAGHRCDFDLTAEQAESVADWICTIWHVAPVSVPLFLEKFGEQISAETVKRLRAIAAAAAQQGKAFRQVAAEVAQAFANRGIELVALKGTASGFLAFDNPEHRTGADLDFCVRPEALDDAKQVLRSIGFWPGDYDPEAQVFVPTDTTQREQREDGHYALGFWLKILDLGEVDAAAADGFSVADELLPFASQVDGRRVKTPVLVDVHHSIGAGVSAADLMDRALPVVWNGTEIFLPPRDWAAFHAMFKLYWEGGQSYRKGFQYLADFARIMARHGRRRARRAARPDRSP